MSKHRVSVDIEEEDHRYLKMCCAKLGVSIKDFVLKSIINSVDAQEDEWWLELPETKELLKDSQEGRIEFIPFEEVLKELAISV